MDFMVRGTVETFIFLFRGPKITTSNHSYNGLNKVVHSSLLTYSTQKEVATFTLVSFQSIAAKFPSNKSDKALADWKHASCCVLVAARRI